MEQKTWKQNLERETNGNKGKKGRNKVLELKPRILSDTIMIEFSSHSIHLRDKRHV